MKYLGYSELTKRLYILPASAKASKIDITDDVNEFIEFKRKEAEKRLMQCDACNSMCKIEGWIKCWDLCTCECHKKNVQ